MRLRLVGLAMSLGTGLTVAASLAGCVPGPAGYAGWSEYRQQQANEHANLSERNAETARSQARRGNYRGAQLWEAAAEDQAAQAQQDQNHAARDRWLSRLFH